MYDIRKVQLAQLDILKQVVALCDKHNIKYYAVYGTLLGVIRHRGFIPWDDDVDIAMLRPDFDRFCKIAEKELQHPYFLQTNKTDPEYFLHIARVQNLNTTLIEKPYSHLDIKFGISVDIYPLDGIKNSEKCLHYFRYWNKVYGFCITDWIDNRNCWKKYVKKFIGLFINLFMYGMKPKQFFYNKIEALYRKFENLPQKFVANYHDLLGNDKEIYDIDFFNGERLGDFEDIKLHLPNNAEGFLEHIYGDYMQLPPENEREPHHGWVAVVPEKPYTEYVNKQN